jgi:hypothetical protein
MLFPCDLSSWTHREEGDPNQLYLNVYDRTVTATPAAIAAEIENPKSKIKIPQNIMLQALVLHQLALAHAPPPPVTKQPKSPPNPHRTDTDNSHSPSYPLPTNARPKVQGKPPKTLCLTQ